MKNIFSITVSIEIDQASCRTESTKTEYQTPKPKLPLSTFRHFPEKIPSLSLSHTHTVTGDNHLFIGVIDRVAIE